MLQQQSLTAAARAADKYQCGLGRDKEYGRLGGELHGWAVPSLGRMGSKSGWATGAGIAGAGRFGSKAICNHLLRAADLMISTNSGFSEAPPTCRAGKHTCWVVACTPRLAAVGPPPRAATEHPAHKCKQPAAQLAV